MSGWSSNITFSTILRLGHILIHVLVFSALFLGSCKQKEMPERPSTQAPTPPPPKPVPTPVKPPTPDPYPVKEGLQKDQLFFSENKTNVTLSTQVDLSGTNFLLTVQSEEALISRVIVIQPNIMLEPLDQSPPLLWGQSVEFPMYQEATITLPEKRLARYQGKKGNTFTKRVLFEDHASDASFTTRILEMQNIIASSSASGRFLINARPTYKESEDHGTFILFDVTELRYQFRVPPEAKLYFSFQPASDSPVSSHLSVSVSPTRAELNSKQVEHTAPVVFVPESSRYLKMDLGPSTNSYRLKSWQFFYWSSQKSTSTQMQPSPDFIEASTPQSGLGDGQE
ncbi:MAG: hypothetical protein SGI71_03445 [Verrucomicrobiota bacterium]|nr:hypothetical protein [Verrucomicrobiota bacterium]